MKVTRVLDHIMGGLGCIEIELVDEVNNGLSESLTGNSGNSIRPHGYRSAVVKDIATGEILSQGRYYVYNDGDRILGELILKALVHRMAPFGSAAAPAPAARRIEVNR